MHNDPYGLVISKNHILITAVVVVALVATAFVAGLGAGKRAVLSAEAIPDTLDAIDDRARAADMMFYGTLGDSDDPPRQRDVDAAHARVAAAVPALVVRERDLFRQAQQRKLAAREDSRADHRVRLDDFEFFQR